MSKKKLEKTVCPICGNEMKAGYRARITIAWEFFRTKGCEDSWLKYRIVSFLEHKSVSKIVCRKCAENIADIVTLKKPEDFVTFAFEKPEETDGPV